MSSPDTQYVLAVDLGSGGPKVALVSDRGEVVAHAKHSIETFVLTGGGAEQDPEQWWQGLRDGARQVLGENRVPAERVVAVCCTGQWSVTVPVGGDGRPLMRAVHWMDSRGAPYSHEITDGWIKVAGYGLSRLLAWLRYTGGVPTHSGADVLAHLLFIKHERPEVYRAARCFLEPVDYLNLRLTGRAVASRGTIYPYLLTDNRNNLAIDYAPRLLQYAGIDRNKLPELVPVDSVIGTLLPEVADELGLAHTTQVIAGNCDSQAAILGSGAVGDFETHACIGTSSWLTGHVPYKKTDLFRYLATMPSALPGKNMVVAELGPAGKCLELLADEWFFCDRPDGADPFPMLEQLAAGVPAGSEGLVFLPWLNGAGPPTGDATARGGFLNQSLRSTRAHACRAALEGVALNLRWLLENVEHFVGRRQQKLHFIGGGARIELWGQILADVVDRPVHVVAEPNLAIVRGAGLAAWLALGKLQVGDIAGLTRMARVHQPTAENAKVYQELFAALVDCYKSNKRWFARRNARHTLPRHPSASEE